MGNGQSADEEEQYGREEGSSYKKETDVQFYARMERERIQREVERQRKKLEEQSRMDVENKRRTEQRRIEEEMRKRTEMLEEAERKLAEEERIRRSKMDIERLLTKQRDETARLLEEQRLRMENEIQRAKEERDYQERRRRLDDEKRSRERLEREIEMERRNQADRLNSVQQLHLSKQARKKSLTFLTLSFQAASSSLATTIAAAAADSTSSTEKLIQELAAENEAQRQLNLRTNELQEELAKAAIEEKKSTSQFVKQVDDSMHAKILEMELEKKRQLEESYNREKQRGEIRMQLDVEWKMKRDMEEAELREKNRLYQESTDQIRREAEIDAVRNEEELTRLRKSHTARVEALLKEERRKMEEINRIKLQKEEERRIYWNRMMQGFGDMMRAGYAGMRNKEMEKKWDDRFNQLRRANDPVKEAFFNLQCIPLRPSDSATSLIQFESYLYSLGMSLTTLEEIMASEHQQVETWKEQQPGAYFLADLGSALEKILSCVVRVRREIEMLEDGIVINRDIAQELEKIFELRYLQEVMTGLTDAVDAIPTVYEFNQKYKDRV